MLSNPCSYFVDGVDRKEFEHEGGKCLYHFSPKDCGLSDGMEMNLIFFAEDKAHAANIVSRMLRFKIRCIQENDKKSGYESRPKQLRQATHLLDNQHLWKFSLAPTGQFYKVGWANNDEA